MKNVKQIREDQVSLSENVESSADVRKLSMLVKAGLFDPNKLTMLKRALNKDNVKMTRAERDALLELLDRLLTTVMANQGTFMKVKQSIAEEIEEPTEEELNEGSKVDVDINQIPSLIIMKRRAIRVFPDGQKVALYWADRINKYISVPFQSIGISEETIGEAKKSKKNKDDKLANYYRRTSGTSNNDAVQLRKDLRTSKTFTGALKTASRDASGDTATRLGATLGGAMRLRAMKKGAEARVKKTRSSAGITALRKKSKMVSTVNPARASEVKTLAKSHSAAAAGMGHSESFRTKLAMIRENREIDENLVTKIIGGVAGAVVKGGKKLLQKVPKTKVPKTPKTPGIKKPFRSSRLGKLARLALGAGGAGGGGGGDGGSSSTDIRVQRPGYERLVNKAGVDPYKTKRTRDFETSASQNESVELLKNLKVIAESSGDTVLNFVDGTINVSPSVASKIVETYNALNSENKKVVQEMINRDKNSFMKFANFASSK